MLSINCDIQHIHLFCLLIFIYLDLKSVGSQTELMKSSLCREREANLLRMK